MTAPDTQALELSPQMKRLRNACRTVADQYDEFGTFYDEALSELYNAEDAFWKASEEVEAPSKDKP